MPEPGYVDINISYDALANFAAHMKDAPASQASFPGVYLPRPTEYPLISHVHEAITSYVNVSGYRFMHDVNLAYQAYDEIATLIAANHSLGETAMSEAMGQVTDRMNESGYDSHGYAVYGPYRYRAPDEYMESPVSLDVDQTAPQVPDHRTLDELARLLRALNAEGLTTVAKAWQDGALELKKAAFFIEDGVEQLVGEAEDQWQGPAATLFRDRSDEAVTAARTWGAALENRGRAIDVLAGTVTVLREEVFARVKQRDEELAQNYDYTLTTPGGSTFVSRADLRQEIIGRDEAWAQAPFVRLFEAYRAASGVIAAPLPAMWPGPFLAGAPVAGDPGLGGVPVGGGGGLSGLGGGGGLGTGDLGLTDPALTDPGLLDPGLTDPGLLDPGLTDPGLLDPGLTDPGLTDSGLTDPLGGGSSSADVGELGPDALAGGAGLGDGELSGAGVGSPFDPSGTGSTGTGSTDGAYGGLPYVPVTGGGVAYPGANGGLGGPGSTIGTAGDPLGGRTTVGPTAIGNAGQGPAATLAGRTTGQQTPPIYPPMMPPMAGAGAGGGGGSNPRKGRPQLPQERERPKATPLIVDPDGDGNTEAFPARQDPRGRITSAPAGASGQNRSRTPDVVDGQAAGRASRPA